MEAPQRSFPPQNATNGATKLEFRGRVGNEKACVTSSYVTQASEPAERAGFEPAVEFPPHSISSAAQSTTPVRSEAGRDQALKTSSSHVQSRVETPRDTVVSL